MSRKQSILIDDIRVGTRHRRDMGDLKSLADSIEQDGLLQPIGITPDNELVFGERRLRAVRDILGWDRIDCRMVNVSSIVAGEYAENECRKDFTPMERVAIGKTLETEIGKRQGGDRRSSDFKPDPSPACSKAGDTRDVVARQIGFGSGKQYERAKQVDAKGSAELKAAVDRGDIDITTAAKLVELPKGRQTEIVRQGKAEIKRVARDGDVPKGPPPKPPKEYPVSDQFMNWGNSLGGFCTQVKTEYGGVAAMIAHDGWDPKCTKWAVDYMDAIAESVNALNEEFKNATSKNKNVPRANG